MCVGVGVGGWGGGGGLEMQGGGRDAEWVGVEVGAENKGQLKHTADLGVGSGEVCVLCVWVCV